MEHFNEILVAVDESDAASFAFEKALFLARQIEGRITLLHVIPPIVGGTPALRAPPNMAIMEGASKLLEGFKEKVQDDDLEILTSIKNGDPSGKIIEMSKDYDMLVIGNRGHGAISSILLGSVADKVARDACCPVLLVGNACK